MLERIVPPGVQVRSTREEIDAELFPEEQALVARAVEGRRREFATARACAREALAGLGVRPRPILAGPAGEPLWPPEVVGSITHCDGYRACAVARSSDLLGIGVDAEPDRPLPARLRDRVARPEERELLRELSAEVPDVHCDRLLFVVKEAVFKAWFPLTGRRLGLHDTSVAIDRRGGFAATLFDREPVAGRWLAADGLLLAAVAHSSSS